VGISGGDKTRSGGGEQDAISLDVFCKRALTLCLSRWHARDLLKPTYRRRRRERGDGPSTIVFLLRRAHTATFTYRHTRHNAHLAS